MVAVVDGTVPVLVDGSATEEEDSRTDQESKSSSRKETEEDSPSSPALSLRIRRTVLVIDST